LSDGAEGFAGVEVARPRANLTGGVEVGVAVATEEATGVGIVLEGGSGGAGPGAKFANDDGYRLSGGGCGQSKGDGLPGGEEALGGGEVEGGGWLRAFPAPLSEFPVFFPVPAP
jgi:hypothetical protein